MKLASLKGYMCGNKVLDTSIRKNGDVRNLHGLSAESYELQASINSMEDIKVLVKALEVLSYSLMIKKQ